jgi:hypothetical protein
MFAKLIVFTAVLVFGWAAFVRPLGAHGPEQTYVVKPYDTLWSIASSHYAGDARDAIYRIEAQNHLHGGALTPGETLVLP